MFKFISFLSPFVVGCLALAQEQEVVATSPTAHKMTDYVSTKIGTSFNQHDETRHTETFDGEIEFKVKYGKSTFEWDSEVEHAKINLNKETTQSHEISYDYSLIKDFLALQVVYFNDSIYTLDRDANSGSRKTYRHTVDSYGIGPEFTFVKNDKLMLMMYMGPASHVQTLKRKNVNPVNPGANYSTDVKENQTTLFTRTTIEAPKIFGSHVDYKLVLRYEPKSSDLSDHDIDIKHNFKIPLGYGFGISYENAQLYRTSPMKDQSASRTSQDLKIEYVFKKEIL